VGKRPITLIIAGAGGRGGGYAAYAKLHPDRVRVVGVAEPRAPYRDRLAAEHAIPREHVFDDWKAMAAAPRFADAVTITTQDAMHLEPSVAFAEKGYHLLLEKPMAPNERDCITITEAAKRNDVILAVGHVMRYTDYTRSLKECVDSGAIGEIASIEHLEPVGYWHQAHSFVRGNWRNESESSPMLLAKSCHDIDWLRYIVGRPCRALSSFGSLLHFRSDRKPPEAGKAKRCTACSFEPSCPYSALKLYLPKIRSGHTGWPIDVVTPEHTEDALMKALETGPYGRCVYECDNDVVDHQVVIMRFEGDVTASFTMTAFTESTNRKTRIFGTRGMIEGDGRYVRRFDFLTDTWHETDSEARDGSITGGHGGGDEGLMTAFTEAVATGDRSRVLSGPDESLETHLMVFAAERARRTGTVVSL
jgi:predicted dehydrogenase